MRVSASADGPRRRSSEIEGLGVVHANVDLHRDLSQEVRAFLRRDAVVPGVCPDPLTEVGVFLEGCPESKALLEIGAVQPRRHIVDGSGPRGAGPFDHALRVNNEGVDLALIVGHRNFESGETVDLTAQDGLVSILRAAEVNRRIGSLPRGLCSATLAVHIGLAEVRQVDRAIGHVAATPS